MHLGQHMERSGQDGQVTTADCLAGQVGDNAALAVDRCAVMVDRPDLRPRNRCAGQYYRVGDHRQRTLLPRAA